MSAKLGTRGWLIASTVVVVITAAGLYWKYGAVPGSTSNQPASVKTGTESLREKLAGLSAADLQERLRKLTAAERKELLDEVAKRDDYHAVAQGSLSRTLLEKGSIQPKTMCELTCFVRPASPKTQVAANVRWVINDRTNVKMGDKLIEFYDAPFHERLKVQQAVVADAELAVQKAKEAVDEVDKGHHEYVRLAEAEVKLALLALKRETSEDPQQKQKLQTDVKQAGATLEQIRSKAGGPSDKAAANYKAKLSALEEARIRQRDLEDDLAGCTLYAPRDGQVVFAKIRLRPNIKLTEGQKLMWVCDLDKLKMAVEVKGDQAAQVQPGQKAYVSLERFSRPYPAKVTHVAKKTVGKDGQVFQVDVEIKDDVSKLLPGMIGTALIVIDARTGCVRLPLAALLGQGEDKYCMVLEGKEVHDRRVIVGLVGDKEIVEIKEGLKAGDLVLSDPRAAISRMTQTLKTVKK